GPHRDSRLGAVGGDDRVHVHGAALEARAPVRDGLLRGLLRRRARRAPVRRRRGAVRALAAGREPRGRDRGARGRLGVVPGHRDDDRGPAARLAREGDAARLRRAGRAPRRLRRLLPRLGPAGLDAVAVDHLAGDVRVARDPRRDPRRRRPRHALGRRLAAARDRRRRDPARAGDVPPRRALREAAREAEAVRLAEGRDRALPSSPASARYADGSTTISEFPSGSRTQNIGGTGPPQRETSASTSAPADLSAAWSPSTSVVSRQMPVWLPPAAVPFGGGASAIVVGAPGRATSTQRPASPIGTSTTFSKPSVLT